MNNNCLMSVEVYNIAKIHNDKINVVYLRRALT
jgi:hypothetical protein